MRHKFIWSVVILFLISCMVPLYADNPEEKDIKVDIYQIKVSLGHATLIVVRNTENNSVISSTLIDAGNSEADAIIVKDVIQSQAGGRLDHAFVTHNDADHIRGFNKIIDFLKDGLSSTVAPPPGKNVIFYKNDAKRGSLANSIYDKLTNNTHVNFTVRGSATGGFPDRRR